VQTGADMPPDLAAERPVARPGDPRAPRGRGLTAQMVAARLLVGSAGWLTARRHAPVPPTALEAWARPSAPPTDTCGSSSPRPRRGWS